MTDDQKTQRLAEILGRIAKLPSANLEPPQFFASFLQLTVVATGSRGGAIWVIQAGQGPQCYCHLELDLCRFKEAHQQRVILQALDQTVKEGKALVLPAGDSQGNDEMSGAVGETESGETATANQCDYPLFFTPLRAAGQVAMIVQMIGASDLSPHDFRAVVGLLDNASEAAQTYLAHRRAAVLEDDRKSLARLLAYCESVHGSLDAQKVVYEIANLGRDAIGCTRVVVWIDPRVKRGLRAVSGVDKPDRRAVLIQSLEKLSRHCLQIKKPIVAARDQLAELDEEEPVTQLFKDYFNVSQLNQILLQPMQKDDDLLGVVIAEGFEEQSSTNLAGITAAVSKHGAVALSNALEMGSLPLVRPWSRLQKAKKDPKKRRNWLVAAVVIAVLLVGGALIPWTIQIDSACELTPKYKRLVDSPLDGVQISKILRPSGEVAAGEVIAQLNDAELRSQLYSLEAGLQQQEVKKNEATRPAQIELIRLEQERLSGQVELVKMQIEKCKVRAPIAGMILTDRLELTEGLTLKLGDPICEIADLSHWELLLDVPQEEIDWVRRGLEDGEPSQVAFFLAAFPQHKLTTNVSSVDQIRRMAQTKEEGNVYGVRVEVLPEQLEDISDGLRDGMIGRAKIATVDRALGYVLLRKVIRFFRVTFF